MSWIVANHPTGEFYNNLMGLIYTGAERLGTRVLMGNKVTSRCGGKIEVLRELKTEDDRLVAFKDFFGIEYPADAVKYVANRGASFSS